MFGSVERTTDYSTGAGPTFATGAVPGVALQFWVEEDEMLVDLVARVTLSNTVVEPTDVTIFVSQNGATAADIASGANGLARVTPAVAADENTVYGRKILRLPKGRHVAQVHVKAPTGVVTVQGASIPCELAALRLSHIGTLGHGVDSKALLIQ